MYFFQWMQVFDKQVEESKDVKQMHFMSLKINLVQLIKHEIS